MRNLEIIGAHRQRGETVEALVITRSRKLDAGLGVHGNDLGSVHDRATGIADHPGDAARDTPKSQANYQEKENEDRQTGATNRNHGFRLLWAREGNQLEFHLLKNDTPNVRKISG